MIEDTAFAVEGRGAAPDDILIGAELARRPARQPDFAAESEALHTLARLLIDDPEVLPKRLTEIALDLCHAGSAGVSLLEETPQGAVFRWTALAGQLGPYQGGSTPRDFSPCGLCLDRGEAILVADPARRFDYFNAVGSPIVEGLVLPLFGAAKRPLGTLWIVAHDRERQFDGEDLRVMTRLADFTALAIECGAAHAAAKAGEQRSRELLDALPAAIYTTDAAGRITYYNAAAVDLAGRRPEVGRDQWCVTGRLYRPDGTPLPHEECPMAVALKENRPVRGEEAVAERPDGARVPFIPYPTPLRDASGALVGAVNMLVDITERKRAEALTECQKHALQMLAEGAPLDHVLGYLIRTIEGHSADGMLGSILLLNGAGTHFERGIGPSLPEEFNAAVKGIAVSSAIGVCCRAVSRRAAVVVPDFGADPQWAGFVEFVAPYDLRAGWSTPIFGSDGKVIGTFANYYRHPCDPAPSDLEWVEIVKRTAAIAIERAQAEAALRESRENLTAALAASDTGTFRWNPHTDEFLEFDDNLKRLFGFASGDQVRVTGDFIARVHPDDLAALVPAVESSRHGADFSMEYRVVLPDGAVRWLYGRAKMERDAAGNPTYLVGACTDITKRKEAEAALHDREEQFRTLAESIPQLAWMARPDGWIFWYNQRWYNYTDTTLQEMQGWGWRKVHHPDHERRVVERIQRSWDTGDPWEDTFPLRGADGRYRWFLSRALPIRDGEGRIVRWFGTNTDVTEQREAQEAQRRASQILEERVAERTRQLTAETAERRKVEAALQQARHLEAIGQLTGGVAHDFNNLLTVISGQSEGIAAAAKDHDIRRRAGAIQRAAERGARLTSQLLAFSRRQRLSPQRVTIGRLMADIDDLVRRAVGETVTVAFSADPDLWPSLIDPAQFESAILNLAINAKDAMPAGGRLAIAARNAAVADAEATRLDIRPGDYVVVKVADTGTGMSAEIRDHAFEPFFTTKDVGKGTGLGLAQIYGFVRQSGGAVALESMVGKGTTVSLHLPRAEAKAAEELTLASEPILPGPSAGKTILVVEDQPDVRVVIEAALSELGCRILIASDGIEARQMLDSDESIDLLLTDLVMPNGVSGLDLVEGARRLRQDLKIVVVSGYSRDARIRAGSLRDRFTFLEKPFRQAELADCIAAALAAGPG